MIAMTSFGRKESRTWQPNTEPMPAAYNSTDKNLPFTKHNLFHVYAGVLFQLSLSKQFVVLFKV